MIAYLYDLSETVVSFCLEDVADIQNKLLQQINTWWINKNLQTWAVTYLSFKKQYLFTSVLLFCSFLLTRTSRTPTIKFQAFIPRCLKTSDVGLNFNTCLNKCSVLERVVAANWDCSAPSSGCSTLVSLIQEGNISSKPEWIYSPQTKVDLNCGEIRPQSHCVSSNARQKNISCQCFSTKCGDSGPNLHIVASWSPTDTLQGKERTCCGTGIIHPPDIENPEGWLIAGIPPLSDLPSSPYRFSESTCGSVPCSCWRSSTYFPFASGTSGILRVNVAPQQVTAAISVLNCLTFDCSSDS